MPTNTLSVAINARASWIIKPTPFVAPSNSAATKHIQAVLNDNRIPNKMFGNDPGNRTFVIFSTVEYSKIFATSNSLLSTLRTPKNDCKYKGKNAPNDMSNTFDSSPKPNHKINNGVIASNGTVRTICKVGFKYCSVFRFMPTQTPKARPR